MPCEFFFKHFRHATLIWIFNIHSLIFYFFLTMLFLSEMLCLAVFYFPCIHINMDGSSYEFFWYFKKILCQCITMHTCSVCSLSVQNWKGDLYKSTSWTHIVCSETWCWTSFILGKLFSYYIGRSVHGLVWNNMCLYNSFSIVQCDIIVAFPLMAFIKQLSS